MYKTINFSDFCDAFKGSQYENSFTYQGKQALFKHLEELEESSGQPIELDIVDLCCEYTEYETALEGAKENWYELGKNTENETEEWSLEFLKENTTVIDVAGGGVIIKDF